MEKKLRKMIREALMENLKGFSLVKKETKEDDGFRNLLLDGDNEAEEIMTCMQKEQNGDKIPVNVN